MAGYKRLKEFEKGVLCAAAVLQMVADEPGLAADILRQTGLNKVHCSKLDECDKEALRVVNQEKGMALTGLE